MLQEGQTIIINDKTYKVTRVPKRILACIGMCDLKNCHENVDFNNIKKAHNARSCAELLSSIDLCLKRVE